MAVVGGGWRNSRFFSPFEYVKICGAIVGILSVFIPARYPALSPVCVCTKRKQNIPVCISAVKIRVFP
jgi:hypothetical protein